jgi:hypothetical protein
MAMMMRRAHSAAWGNEVPRIFRKGHLDSAVRGQKVAERRVFILKPLVADEFRIMGQRMHDFRMIRTELVEGLQIRHREVARRGTLRGDFDLPALCEGLGVRGKQSRD